jgi:hypothetical protein
MDTLPAGLEGGCLCGKVRFEARQMPWRTLACHCTFCQRMTGSSFYTESLFPMEAVVFNAGEVRKYAHVSDSSGKKVYVEFCPACGTTLGLSFERWPELRAISRGCFDDPDAVPVTGNIWTRSAQTGIALPSGIDCFETSRATLEGKTEVPQRHQAPVMAKPDREACAHAH